MSDTTVSPSARAAFWTLDQEVFEKERSPANRGLPQDMQVIFAICGLSLRCFNPDDLILRSAVWALKTVLTVI